MNGILLSVQRSFKVEEITSAKDEPPSMFILEELCGMARGSAVDANGIAQQLVKKLNNPQAIVKAKALKAIKVLAQKGGPQFQKSITKFSTQIRELQRYSGPPDQFVGDVYNKRVRDCAGEAIEAMFNPQQSSTTSEDPSLKDRIKGIGGSGPGFISSSGFQDNNPLQYATSQSSCAPTQTPSGAKRSVYDKTPPPIGTGKKMEGFGNTSPAYEAQFPSNASSGTLQAAPMPFRSASSGSFTEVVKLPGSINFRNDPAKAAQMIGSEDVVVDEICAPGGIKATPSSEDLRKFVEKVSVLDGEKIATQLEIKVASSNWQTKLRALCGLEAIMNFGSTESCLMAVQHFIINPESIEKCRQSQQISIKEKAEAIYKIIGAEPSHQNGSTGGGQQQTDLLSDLTETNSTTAVPNGNTATDPFDTLVVGSQVQQPLQPQQKYTPQTQSQQSVNINLGPTISTELSNLHILDAQEPVLQTTAALDEALFSDFAVAAVPTIQQFPMVTQQATQQQQQVPLQSQQQIPSMMQAQPTPYQGHTTSYFPQQQQQQMYGFQMPQAGYPLNQMGMGGAGMQQQVPLSGPGLAQYTGVQYQQQSIPMQYGSQFAQFQNQTLQTVVSNVNSKKTITPKAGKVKKEGVFDFVQDHMDGLQNQ